MLHEELVWWSESNTVTGWRPRLGPDDQQNGSQILQLRVTESATVRVSLEKVRRPASVESASIFPDKLFLPPHLGAILWLRHEALSYLSQVQYPL